MDFDSLACYLLDAIASGNASLVVALILCLVVFGVRALVAPRVAFFSSDLGGALLAFLVGASGAILTAVTAGAALSFTLFFNAANISIMAMGGYSAIKKLLLPLAVRGLAKLGVNVSLEAMTKALSASEPKKP